MLIYARFGRRDRLHSVCPDDGKARFLSMVTHVGRDDARKIQVLVDRLICKWDSAVVQVVKSLVNEAVVMCTRSNSCQVVLIRNGPCRLVAKHDRMDGNLGTVDRCARILGGCRNAACKRGSSYDSSKNQGRKYS